MKENDLRIFLIVLGLSGVLLGAYVLWQRQDPHPLQATPAAAVAGCKENCIAIAGAVVPHHDLVAALRAEFFATMARSVRSPRTIILLSTNHYHVGYGHIQTTDQVWHLGAGQIQPHAELISLLVAKKLATREPSSFATEHGIYNILGDIQKNFPEATIVPLIFQDTSMAELTDIEQELNASCASCLMIASVDFSHYQPAILGEVHDERSIRDLDTLNTQDIFNGPEVDSGPALALLTLWARGHDAEQFVLKNHTNSGIIAADPDLESTTHVFGWYEPGAQIMPQQSVSFLIGGDVMFARMISHTFGKNFNDAFVHFGDRVFWGTDAAIINLEGAITNQPIQDNISTNDLTFRFSPAIVKTLSFLHINGASQANNHSNNAGGEGVSTTRSVLNAAGIQSFGGPTGASVARAAVFHGSGLSLTVIGVNMLAQGQAAEALVPVIKEAKRDPHMKVLVMPHWGVEYNQKHTASQAAAAHVWADAGADIIVGSHPHVIEDTELYHGVPIIYSLGNLLFDQTFSKATQEGLLIAGSFTPEGLTFFGLPVESVKYQPQLMIGPAKKQILDAIYFPFYSYIRTTPAGAFVTINKK